MLQSTLPEDLRTFHTRRYQRWKMVPRNTLVPNLQRVRCARVRAGETDTCTSQRQVMYKRAAGDWDKRYNHATTYTHTHAYVRTVRDLAVKFLHNPLLGAQCNDRHYHSYAWGGQGEGV